MRILIKAKRKRGIKGGGAGSGELLSLWVVEGKGEKENE